jgi:DNA-binding transcriptional ArsR family regulator
MLGEPQDATCAPQIEGEYPVAEIGEILQALADPVRLSIVRSLAECGGEQSCGVFNLPVTKPTQTHHFRILKLAGLIGSRMEGTRKFMHLRRQEVDAAYPGLLDSVLQGRRSETPAR